MNKKQIIVEIYINRQSNLVEISTHETNEDDTNEHRINRDDHASENSIIQKPINNKPIHIKYFVNDSAPTGTSQRTTVKKENL